MSGVHVDPGVRSSASVRAGWASFGAAGRREIMASTASLTAFARLVVPGVSGGVLLMAASAWGQVTPIELTPTQVGSGDTTYFTTAPTVDPALFFGAAFPDVRLVNFNTAPDGALVEGGTVITQYASLGVTMNDIRISAAIYGGNNYGPGFATEENDPQVYTFTTPVRAVGIVNTSPDKDLVQFYSGPNATGTLLFSFNDQQGVATNFNIDRFVGGIAADGVTIGSFVVSNQSGDLELDELIFALATNPKCPADLNGDGSVDGADLGALLGAWNEPGPGDLDGSGTVDGADLGMLLAAWGAC